MKTYHLRYISGSFTAFGMAVLLTIGCAGKRSAEQESTMVKALLSCQVQTGVGMG